MRLFTRVLLWLALAALVAVPTSCGNRTAGIAISNADGEPAAQPTPASPGRGDEPTPVPASTTTAPDAGTADPAGTNDAEPTTTVFDAEPASGDATVISVEVPAIQAISLPQIGELTDAGKLVEERLAGVVVSAISGVEVVAASCEAEGGELAYGDQGDDVFEADGSGSVVDDENGLTTLAIEADGAGTFYTKPKDEDELLTITVAPDGSGEFYSLRGTELTTIKTEADGSGVYFLGPDPKARKATGPTTTVTIRPDGSGELFSESDEQLLTIAAAADGSGEYFFENADRRITIKSSDDGSWQLTDDGTNGEIELLVRSDGTGRYARRSLPPVVVDFDASGFGTYDRALWKVDVPPRPAFAVADRFPPLGQLGALQPPCATVIRFESALLFDFGEAEIRDGLDDTLNQVVAALNDIGQAIEINGHTDSKGTVERNQELSLDRANAVEAALTERGLDVEIVTQGFGELSPVAANELPDGEDNPAGRALNRRVEIVIRD